jgi:hypothetical protein
LDSVKEKEDDVMLVSILFAGVCVLGVQLCLTPLSTIFHLYLARISHSHGRDRMVFGFTTTFAIGAHRH